jgi:hypothetical protein
LVAALSPAAQRLLSTALTHYHELVVRGIAYRCPRCGLEGTAVAVVHPDYGTPDVSDMIDAQSGVVLEFAKELLQEARHPAATAIKHRRHADGEKYLTVGCMRCDEMLDAWDLADALDQVRDQDGVESLPVLARRPRTIAEWSMLVELSKTSGFDAD